MRNSVIATAVVALGSLVSAQWPGEPSCAVPCITSALSIAGCQRADEACQCGPQFSSIQALAGPCLLSACNVSELQLVASAGLAICSVYSASQAYYTVVITTTSSSPSSSAAPTSPSSTPVSTTRGTAVTTNAPATTSAPSTSAMASSHSARSSSAASSSASASANAALAIMPGLGGLMGVVAAFVAAL